MQISLRASRDLLMLGELKNLLQVLLWLGSYGGGGEVVGSVCGQAYLLAM